MKVQTVLLNAGDSYNLEVTANVDDSIVIKEELHIMVDEGIFYFADILFILLMLITSFLSFHY